MCEETKYCALCQEREKKLNPIIIYEYNGKEYNLCTDCHNSEDFTPDLLDTYEKYKIKYNFK